MKQKLTIFTLLLILLAVMVLIPVRVYGAPLNLVSGVNNVPAGKWEWPSGKNLPPLCTIIGAVDAMGLPLAIISAPPNGDGQGMCFRGDGLTIRNVKIVGGSVFLDKAGGRNSNIVFDNVEFQNTGTGGNSDCIKFTSGLVNSRITNCLFTGAKHFGIYGYNYSGLTIANNDFIGCRAGMHIDAFGNCGNLLVEQNYVTGVVGMGMEFQGTASGLIFQDNHYEKPSNEASGSKMAYSLILDKSSNITIQRNVALMPTRSAEPSGYVRIVFEVGGDNCLVTQNYSNGGNHVVAMNDGVGSASVTVKNNRILNYAQGISNSFPAGDRVLSQANNSPTVNLEWDINRPRPGRHRRLGAPPTVPQSPPPATLPADPQIAVLKARVAALELELASEKSDRDAIAAKLATLKAKLVELGSN